MGAAALACVDDLEPSDSQHSGWWATVIGDVDGDGTDELALRTRFDPVDETERPELWIVSGASGRPLVRLRVQARATDRSDEPDEIGERELLAYWSVLGVEDVDGDGGADFALGLEEDSCGGKSAGAVRVISGRSGATIWETYGPTPRAGLGSSLALGDDVDGDGRRDLIACGEGAYSEGVPGCVLVLSARDGRMLAAADGPRVVWGDEDPHDVELADLGFGVAASRIGDVDRDRISDVAVGAPYGPGFLELRGSIHAYSGRDLAPLWSAVGEPDEFLGFEIAAIRDRDGDGIDEVLATSSDGPARILSGKDGASLETWTPWQSLAPIGDFDGDSREEFCATRGLPAETILVLSGVSREPLGTVERPNDVDEFGFTIPPASLGFEHGARRELVVVSNPYLLDEAGELTVLFGRVDTWTATGAPGSLHVSRDSLRAAVEAGLHTTTSRPAK